MTHEIKFDRLSILMAVSNLQAAEAYAPMLRTAGAKKVVIAASNVEALDLLQESSFNLVVIDDRFPKVGGFDFCRFLRLTSISASVAPIVFGLHAPDQATVMKARDAGASKIIALPLTGQGLQAAILQAANDLRPLVQTSAYRGPDRRHAHNPNYKGPERRKEAPEIVTVEQRLKALF